MYGSVGGVAMPQALRMTGPTAMFARLNGAVDGSAVEPPPAKVSTPERSRDKAMSAGGYGTSGATHSGAPDPIRAVAAVSTEEPPIRHGGPTGRWPSQREASVCGRYEVAVEKARQRAEATRSLFVFAAS